MNADALLEVYTAGVIDRLGKEKNSTRPREAICCSSVEELRRDNDATKVGGRGDVYCCQKAHSSPSQGKARLRGRERR